MVSNNCGKLSAIDLSNISVSLRKLIYETKKNIKDVEDELQQLKTEGESGNVIRNVTALVDKATEVYTDRIRSIEETEKTITECIRD